MENGQANEDPKPTRGVLLQRSITFGSFQASLRRGFGSQVKPPVSFPIMASTGTSRPLLATASMGDEGFVVTLAEQWGLEKLEKLGLLICPKCDKKYLVLDHMPGC